jgi:hypothetical protein
MKFVENAGKVANGELSVLLNLLFHCMHQIFINHRWLAAPQVIVRISAPFIKVSHPSLTIESLMACSPYTSQS